MLKITKGQHLFQLSDNDLARRAGFTLIELLMAMDVMAGLASLVILTVPNALSKGRDGRRKNDIRSFQPALETYAQANGGYFPSYTNGVSTNTICTTTNTSGCPADPQTSNAFQYWSNGTNNGLPSATTYVISGTLEEKDKSTNQNYVFVVCSDGRSGKVNPPNSFTNGVCPSTLLP